MAGGGRCNVIVGVVVRWGDGVVYGMVHPGRDILSLCGLLYYFP